MSKLSFKAMSQLLSFKDMSQFSFQDMSQLSFKDMSQIISFLFNKSQHGKSLLVHTSMRSNTLNCLI